MKKKSSSSSYLFVGALASLPVPVSNYQPNYSIDNVVQIDNEVEEVPNSSLPKGVAGYWSPKYQRGAVAKDLPEFFKRHVKIHEYKHKWGIDGTPHGEYLADAYAAAETGNPNLIRGPFYRPPIFFG